MGYKIDYPYYGRTTGGLYFVITAPEYAIVLQHHGTQGFGFSAFVSRNKIIKLFRFSKEITQTQFQEAIQTQINRFFKNIPGAELFSMPVNADIKLLTKGETNASKRID